MTNLQSLPSLPSLFLFLFTLLALTTTPTSAQTKEELGAIFHNGNILKPFLDVPRLTKKRYPYGNSTAESLNQYREEIRNGNDYNLMGENVGEGTTFSDNVVNVSNAYARHFTSARLTTSQGSISMGRWDVSTVKIGSRVIIAGGVTEGDGGKSQRQVDIWTSVRDTTLAAIPTSGFQSNELSFAVNAIPVGLVVPNDADKKLKVQGIGIPYDTFVTSIVGTTLTLSRKTNGINTGTQVYFTNLPDVPVEETGSWTFSGEALSVARQGIAACSDDEDDVAIFGGGFAIESGNVEITLYDTVDIFKNSVWTTSAFPEKSWSAALPSSTPAALTDRSHKRYDAEAAYLGGKAYFAGGVSGVPADVTVMFERRVDIYDVATSTWSLLPGPPANQNLKCLANEDYYCPEGMYTARANFAMVACDLPSSGLGAGNDLLFFAGGNSEGKYYRLAEPTEYLSQVDIFDVTANAWLPITYFPSGIGRSNLASAYFDGKVFFAGGATATRFTDAVDIYNPVTKSWVVSPSVCCGAHNYDDIPSCKTSFADPRCETQRLSQPRANPFMTTLEYRPNINYKPNKIAVRQGDSIGAGATACASGKQCVKQFDEMLVVVGGLTGGSSSRWFFEARGMASPRIDFIKGTHSYWQDTQGSFTPIYDNANIFTGKYKSIEGVLVGVSCETKTQHFMHDVASRGIMDGSVMGANGKLFISAGLTNLHLPSLRTEIIKWKRPYICASISRDNDMCAFTDMERIQPAVIPPKTPTCDYQYLPAFKPWFCPCPNIRAVTDLQRDPINFDFECATGGKATWPSDSGDDVDATKCRTSPMCFTKCLINTEALAAKEHKGHQRGWDDCPGLWERPYDDADEAYMVKDDITVPYFGVHKFDEFFKRVTFGVVQTRFRDVYQCPRDCFPCGERASKDMPGYPFEGTCVKPGGRRESGCVGSDRTLRLPIHPQLTRVKCEDITDKGVSVSTLY